MKQWYASIALLLVACSGKQSEPAHAAAATVLSSQLPMVTVRSNDRLLALKNGTWFYQNKVFSGTIETFDEAGVLRASQSFFDGREEGLFRSYYSDGKPDAERYYHAGEKDSINRGWWPNGKLRFEYHFKKGEYEGDFKEWWASGKPLKHIYYHQGKEQWGRGWRENGKPYMSFAVRNGRLYGSVNPNLCYSLKNGKGEYIAVRK